MRISDWSSDVCSSDLSAAMNAQVDGTHYRKVFDSPYLSSMDVVEPITLTIARVTQEADKTKKTKDTFNTAYFAEKFIRPGEKLKPMILNATNSKTMAKLTGSPYIEDWGDTRITVRSEEHTSELQSLMRLSYAVFCLKKKNKDNKY